MKRRLLATLISGLMLGSGLAYAQNYPVEQEPNSSAPEAQLIDISSGSAIINGVIGNVANDTDYFYFYAKKGDIVNFDIDNGVTSTFGVGVDTSIGVFLSGIDANGIRFPLLRSATFGLGGMFATPDDGSVLDAYGENTDPYIDNFVVPENGYYIVGVAPGYYASFESGGLATNTDFYEAGSYKLIISGVTPNAAAVVAAETAAASTTTTTTTATTTTATTTTADTTTTVAAGTTTTTAADTTTTTATDTTATTSSAPSSVQYVTIDIKPGSKGFGTLNPNANGVIPVAILSSSTFNALTVDTTAVTFGATGKETALIRCSARDVNQDGLLDLVCFADNRKSGFSPMSVEGTVQGSTKSGKTIQGRGPLKVTPVKGNRGGGKKK